MPRFPELFSTPTGRGGCCAHLTSDQADLGNLDVGDDAVSSIRINGDYQVRLYEHTENFGGRYVEVNADEPNLDVTSLGVGFRQFVSQQRLTVMTRERQVSSSIVIKTMKEPVYVCSPV